MRIVKIISYLSFNSLGNLFPSSSSILKGNIFGNVRAFMAMGFICYCGKHINIDKGTTISSHLSIDDYSEIGKTVFYKDILQLENM